MLNLICKLRKHAQEKNLGEMNVELLDTDATSCSITGNNCDFAPHDWLLSHESEGKRYFFDQMDTTLLSFI